MTQAEKDVVDAPIEQKKAAIDIANNEIQTNEVCANHTFNRLRRTGKGQVGNKNNSKQLSLLWIPLLLLSQQGHRRPRLPR